MRSQTATFLRETAAAPPDFKALQAAKALAEIHAALQRDNVEWAKVRVQQALYDLGVSRAHWERLGSGWLERSLMERDVKYSVQINGEPVGESADNL